MKKLVKESLTLNEYESVFEIYMLEWNELKNGEWDSSNAMIRRKLSEINDFMDEHNITIRENRYTIKGWRNNKWEVLVK